MMNPEIQQAFDRFDSKVNTILLDNPKCPAFVKKGYNYIKNMGKGMI